MEHAYPCTPSETPPYYGTGRFPKPLLSAVYPHVTPRQKDSHSTRWDRKILELRPKCLCTIKPAYPVYLSPEDSVPPCDTASILLQHDGAGISSHPIHNASKRWNPRILGTSLLKVVYPQVTSRPYCFNTMGRAYPRPSSMPPHNGTGISPKPLLSALYPHVFDTTGPRNPRTPP